MSRKAHADFKNCLADNRLGQDRIFSVRGLVTHDSRHVGDGIRSCERNFEQIRNATKNADSIFESRLGSLRENIFCC